MRFGVVTNLNLRLSAIGFYNCRGRFITDSDSEAAIERDLKRPAALGLGPVEILFQTPVG
jgi:hypothetical protein